MIIGASTCRAARGLLDWTQAALAAAAHVGLSTVKNFEAGWSFPSPDNLRRMQLALEAAGVEFLPGGAIRLQPDQITFGRDYLVDINRFRLVAHRSDCRITVDISREAIDDASSLTGASRAERHTRFEAHRAEFEACAEDLLRSQAPGISRITIDSRIFHDWRRRRDKLHGRHR